MASDLVEYPNAISQDGKWLLLERQHPKGHEDIWVLPLGEGKAEPKVFLQTPAHEAQADLSPDGRWAAFVSDDTGQAEVYVGAFPELKGKVLVSSGGANHPRWSRDGRELF